MTTEEQLKYDCFAYDSLTGCCTVLRELYCRKENCKFYKTDEEYQKGMRNCQMTKKSKN